MPSRTGSTELIPAVSSPRTQGRVLRIGMATLACTLAVSCGESMDPMGTPGAEEDLGSPSAEEEGSQGGPHGTLNCGASWQGSQWGTTRADEVTSVWGDASGNVYIVGYENGTVGQTNIEPSGNSRAMVKKFAPSGSQSWQKLIDTGGTDTVEHLIGGAQGRVHAVGRTTGALSGFANQGQFDIFSIELDANNGALVGSMQSGDERPQHPVKLGTTAGGGLVIAGYDDLFVKNQQAMDSENGFIGKYAPPAGNPQWWWRSRSLENPDRITGFTMNSPANDEIYTSGFKFFQDEESFGGAFIRRYDLQGAEQWTTQIGFVATEVDELLISPLGNLLAAGSTQLPIIGGEGAGLADAYVASLNRETGELLWASKTGTTEHDFVTAFAQSPTTGDLYVAGDTFGSFPGFTNRGERDLFVLRFAYTGELLGVWQGGTSARDHVGGLWVDGCNNIYLGGYTEGNLLASPKGRDAFLMKVAQPTLPSSVY